MMCEIDDFLHRTDAATGCDEQSLAPIPPTGVGLTLIG
jgi:hypothetical protein